MKTFDLTTIYHKDRPLSWSAISSFEWNPDQWYRKYVLKELPIITPELEFGSMIDKKIQDDPMFLPELVRYDNLQFELRGNLNGVPLLGYADTYMGHTAYSKKSKIRDYKTGRNPWHQKRADETGQITMYLMMLYHMMKIRPEDVECYIDWLPTHIHEGKIAFRDDPVQIHTFKTRRTMADVLRFGRRINEALAGMEAYATRRFNTPPSSKTKVSKFLK